MKRRRLIQLLAASAGLPRLVAAQSSLKDNFYAPVLPDNPLRFPADHGAHWMYRTEWWYLTAWLDRPNNPLGLQLTFFRTRTRHDPKNPSRFAPKQLMFGHAALADPTQPRLFHDELAARVMPSMMSGTDTALSMRSPQGSWFLKREANDVYRAVVKAANFEYSLTIRPPGPPVAQGRNGFSRKGPKASQASYYYSRPQCQIEGDISIGEQPALRVTGTGWLDHEWSSELLDPSAVGWDWIGLNLDNGDALMAFRIRNRDGNAIFTHARWIRNGVVQPTETLNWQVQRVWQSPRTGARYPVEARIRIGELDALLIPLMDDQEINASRSTQTVYWEGAVRLVEKASGQRIGRGYLELTGYHGKIRF